MPPETDWWIWRLVTDPRVKVSLNDLRSSWTFDDADQAHAVLDAIDDYTHKMQERNK